MDLSEAKSKGVKNKRPRRLGRGRGNGHGKTCGRGSKGQGSRSGSSTPVGFEGGQMPLFRRLPKRGFSNALFKKTYTIINVGNLNDFDSGARVDLQTILSEGLTSKESSLLKVLGNGEIEKPLIVVAHKFSKSAREKIEKAGGTAEEVQV